MNLHEYQAKQLFARYGLPAPVGYACTTPREAEEAASKIGAGPWVVKCQVHAGGRGKAGGVKVVNSKEDIRAFAENWLGKRLVTYQTDANGQPVNQILVEAATDIAKELYLGAVVDRSSRRVVFMASTEGGVEIEKVAEETPHLIHKVALDPLTGPMPYQGRELAFKLGLEGKLVQQFTKIFMGLATIFLERDLALIEINPLVITKQGDLICLDGKLGADGNALFRHVKVVNSKEDIRAFAENWLGKRLVTYQTDANGQPVNQILVEAATDIAKELYLGAVVDRSSRRVVFMASTEGGVEIEKVAEETPHLIHKVALDPLTGPMPYQGRELAFKLGLEGKLVQQFTKIFMGLATIFLERDLALIEINPLVITKQGDLICLDGKLGADGNALFRQPDLREMRDQSQEDPREAQAAQWELNYVALDGNIGCMVNGAGLAMGTMDIVKLHGGEPANFLDVGGGATKERVTEAFKIILSDDKVKAVLVNIFGGIVRCDLIADGIIGAVAEVGVNVPVVVRLEGNNAELGAKKLADSGLNIIAAKGLTDAAQQVVAAVEGK